MKMVKNPVKERRKSSLSTVSSTPSPPLTLHPQEPLKTSNDTAFGHNLLLALSKARVKAFQDNIKVSLKHVY